MSSEQQIDEPLDLGKPVHGPRSRWIERSRARDDPSRSGLFIARSGRGKLDPHALEPRLLRLRPAHPEANVGRQRPERIEGGHLPKKHEPADRGGDRYKHELKDFGGW